MPEQPTQTQSQPSQSSKPSASSGNKTILIVIVVIVVLAILGGGGYYLQQRSAEKTAEKTTEKAIEEATGGKADVDVSEGGDKVSIETDEGKLTVGENKVPDSFPSDISVYQGAEVTTTVESEGNIALGLRTGDSVSTVNNFYKDDLTKNGWKVTSTSTVQDTSVIMASKGSRSVIVTTGLDEEDSTKTAIAIVVTTNQ